MNNGRHFGLSRSERHCALDAEFPPDRPTWLEAARSAAARCNQATCNQGRNCTCMPQAPALHWRTKDLTGQRFARLVVLGVSDKRGGNRSQRWFALCECGRQTIVDGAALRSGTTRSCGCLMRDVNRAAGDRTRTHGLSQTSTYNIWDSMRQRCNNPKRKDYPRYGGRGIKVCARWQTFENFLADMGERPPGLTLDRRDNDLDYSKSNCRWATVEQQNRNQRSNVFLEHEGQRLTVAEWAERLGLKAVSLHARLRRGWSAVKTIVTPIRSKA